MGQSVVVIIALCAATIAIVSFALFFTRSAQQQSSSTRTGKGSPYRTPAKNPELEEAERPRWWGRHGVIAEAFVMLALASAAALATLLGSDDEQSYVRRWAFARDATSITVLGLASTADESGRWGVEPDPGGTGARVLANHAGLPGTPPAVAIATEPNERNVRVRTRCRVLVSDGARACGLVFRHRDPQNYYSARVDANLQRVVLSVRENGHERILAHVPALVDAKVWQEVAVDARGDRIAVFWNDERAIEVEDSTHLVQGAAGLWSTATGIAHFDEFSIERLPRPPLSLLAVASSPTPR